MQAGEQACACAYAPLRMHPFAQKEEVQAGHSAGSISLICKTKTKVRMVTMASERRKAGKKGEEASRESQQ
jgi:hypothetical protein